MPAGRPSSYTRRQGQLICDLLSRGKSLLQICSLESMPARETIYRWAREHPEFQANYDAARKLQADHYFDLVTNVAFDESRDVSGELKIPNGVAVNRDRLKVDSLKWILGRMDPGKYGDKVETSTSGKLVVEFVTSIPRPQREDKLLEG